MSIRNALQRFAGRRFNVALLLVAALVACFVGWRDWKSAPVRQHIEAGVQFLQSGQPTVAESEWREAVRLDPENVRAWQLLGEYYQVAEAWPAAVEAFEQVVKIDPQTPSAQAHIATCRVAMKDYKAARQAAQIALQQNPRDAEAVKALVVVAQSTGKGEEELKYLHQLVELLPRDIQALATLSNELTANGDYEQAHPLLERILKIDPNVAVAYSLRGTAYLNGDPTPQGLRDAEKDFKKVLELKPQDVEAHRNLGRIYMRMNKPQQAIVEFEEVGKGRPYASAHFLELSKAYRKAGNIPRADDLARRFTAIKKLNVRLQDLQSRIAPGSNKFENQLSLGLTVLNSLQSDGDSYNFCRFRYARQEIKAPDFYLRQALKLQPHNARAINAMRQLETSYTRHLQTARKALKQRDWTKANAELALVVLLHPEDMRTRTAIRQAVMSNMRAVPTDVVMAAADVDGTEASKNKSVANDTGTG